MLGKHDCSNMVLQEDFEQTWHRTNSLLESRLGSRPAACTTLSKSTGAAAQICATELALTKAKGAR